jgi:hypothetical protein
MVPVSPNIRNNDIPAIRKNEVLKVDTKFEASIPVVEYIFLSI